MVWHIGIDEAGYGPNLGPLVMTSVACRTPEGVSQGDLWKLLKNAVRRPRHKDDGRILVEDSKVVFGQATGIAALEKSVFAFLSSPFSPAPSLTLLIELLSPASESNLKGEHWYTGKSVLPLEAAAEEILVCRQRLTDSCAEAGITWGLMRSVIVCPPEFNTLLDEWRSKGAILGGSLLQLMRENLNAAGTDEPMQFMIDKHGGRNTYSAMIQPVFEEDMVLAREESAYRSCYTVMNREVEIAFEPRADGRHFCVALASMISKYLREALMHEFNQFWCNQVPDLKPTAGYYTDANRFYDAIRPVAEKMGISHECLWRKR